MCCRLGVVVYLDKISTSTVLQTVAIANDLILRSAVLLALKGLEECIATVALIAVRNASVGPSILLAEGCALLDGQAVPVLVEVSSKGLGCTLIIGTTDVFEVAIHVPWLRSSSNDIVGIENGIEFRLHGTDVLRGTKRPAGGRVATRKDFEQPLDSLVDERRLFRAVLVEERIKGFLQRRALLDISIVDCPAGAHALLNRICEHLRIPAVEEISMEPVACCVTVGENEVASFLLTNIIDGVNHLDKQMWEDLRMSWWTDPGIDAIHVRGMRLI